MRQKSCDSRYGGGYIDIGILLAKIWQKVGLYFNCSAK